MLWIRIGFTNIKNFDTIKYGYFSCLRRISIFFITFAINKKEQSLGI
nr:MAG TPA: hypothetical protein [Caudoviricetes sp.]